MSGPLGIKKVGMFDGDIKPYRIMLQANIILQVFIHQRRLKLSINLKADILPPSN